MTPGSAPYQRGDWMTERDIGERIKSLRSELAELERNMPAHGLKPHHVKYIEELEDEIERLEAQLEQLRGV